MAWSQFSGSGPNKQGTLYSGALTAEDVYAQAQQLGIMHASGRIGDDEFAQQMQALGSIKSLDSDQRQYLFTMAQNRLSQGENSRLSGGINNDLVARAGQDYARTDLTSRIASEPLKQYENDAALKRRLVENNQIANANNVIKSLDTLQQSRDNNARLISTALSNQTPLGLGGGMSTR